VIRDDDRGYSLIELLVAVVVTLIVLGLGLGAFRDALRSADVVRLMADTNGNLQSGSNLMVRDLIQAGQGVPIGGLPIPNGGAAVPIVRPGPANAVAAGFPSNVTLYAVIPGDGLGTVVNGAATDVISIAYVDGVLGEMVLSSIAANGQSMRVNPTSVDINETALDTIRPGDLIFFQNANGRAVQQVTSIDNADDQIVRFAPTIDPMRFNQPTVASGSIAPLIAAGAGTSAWRLILVTYFVQIDNGQPTLMRQLTSNAAVPVGLGIENLQIAYDVLNAGVVQTTPSPAAVGVTPNEIHKVYLSIAARSERPIARSTRWLRNSVETQVSLRSLSFYDQFQ
jgi:prepilin-type N-terminal cleavage/methylation domain-containing protein